MQPCPSPRPSYQGPSAAGLPGATFGRPHPRLPLLRRRHRPHPLRIPLQRPTPCPLVAAPRSFDAVVGTARFRRTPAAAAATTTRRRCTDGRPVDPLTLAALPARRTPGVRRGATPRRIRRARRRRRRHSSSGTLGGGTGTRQAPPLLAVPVCPQRWPMTPRTPTPALPRHVARVVTRHHAVARARGSLCRGVAAWLGCPRWRRW